MDGLNLSKLFGEKQKEKCEYKLQTVSLNNSSE